MNQAAQQTNPTPAQRLADKILARTNNGRDLIDLMHDIAQGGYDANEYDRITASKILFDRGYGKCPKQAPVQSLAEEAGPEPSPGEPDGSSQAPDPAPETDHNDVEPTPYSIRGEIRESPPTITHKEPESPRLVNQLDNSLHDSLGPAPSAHSPTRHSQDLDNSESLENPESSDSLDPSSLQSSIQDFIIEITNDGDTLIDVLMDIAYADPADPKVKPFHRKYADRILMDRAFGTDPTPNTTVVQARPEPSQSVPHNPEYPPGYILDPTKDCIDCSPTLGMFEGHEGEHRFDEEAWAEAMEKLQQMVDEHGITPDPNAPKIDWSIYEPPEDWVPHPDEVRKEAAAFEAEIKLRIERQKNWPKIEERRRKKLAQIYPSHSEDDDKTPDT